MLVCAANANAEYQTQLRCDCDAQQPSMVDGPERALNLIDSLAARGSRLAARGSRHHDTVLPALRSPRSLARTYRRSGEAQEAFPAALLSTKLEPERRLLTRRISQLAEARRPVSRLHALRSRLYATANWASPV
jgi:hypothetical protein